MAQSTQSGVSSATSQSAGLDSLISPTEEHYARQQKYMAGSMLDPNEDEDIPLLYFSNPLKFFKWLSSWTIPGLGMFSEAYFIFSIGNIGPILQAEYPECWKKHQRGCTPTITQVPSYIQIVGIVLGMCLLGFVGDKIGRKWGSVLTAALMLVGAILLVATSAPSEKNFVIMYIISQFVFGFGVGGEYPMAAGSAAERAEARGKASAKKRGREVVLTFSMQGVGNFVNTGVLCILMCIFGIATPNHPKNKNNPYGAPRLSGVWRTSFAVGFIPILYMLYYRIFRLRESAVWKKRMTQMNKETSGHFGLLMKHYWHRLLATAGCWFLWDFSFYGNKVFQSAFIKILSPNATILVTLLWTLLNSGVALIGYWLAACVIDNLKVGRLRLQLLGFAMVGILFYISAAAYHPLTSKGGIQTFQFVYFFSSFWGQFGPNCTTFLLAGELYPTEMRTTAHGMSAGIAKLGALWAAIFFNYINSRPKFWWASSFNVAGFFLTLVFLPDPARISLSETDRRWRYLCAGKTYHGEAINSKSLSMFERMFLRLQKHYNRQVDQEEFLADLKADGYIAPDAAGVKGIKGYGRNSPDEMPKGGKEVELQQHNGANGDHSTVV